MRLLFAATPARQESDEVAATQAKEGNTMTAITGFRLRGKPQDSYLAQVLACPLDSIRDEDHLAAAQQTIDRLLAENDLDEGGSLYLDALSDLVATYEDKHHPIPPPSDADMLQHLLEAKGVTQSTLHRDTGIPKSTISEILAGKRPFSRQVIRKLAGYFHVDAGLLASNF